MRHEPRLLGLDVELALAVVDPPGVVADVEHRLLGEHVHLRALDRHGALGLPGRALEHQMLVALLVVEVAHHDRAGCRGPAASASIGSPAASGSRAMPSLAAAGAFDRDRALVGRAEQQRARGRCR